MNRLVKSLPTRFSFRRSSLEANDVLDEENDPKVSRGFRHSMGDIAELSGVVPTLHEYRLISDAYLM